MKYERFEQLPVWKVAVDLAVSVYAFTKDRVFHTDGDLREQIRRAVLSISNNIAEGFERGSTADLLKFLYIARGSAGEVRSMLHFCNRWPEAAHLKSQISNLKSRAESCSRQIRGWANALQNTDIAGQRHLNDRTRTDYEQKQRAAAFQRRLDEIVRGRVEEWSNRNAEGARDSRGVTGDQTYRDKGAVQTDREQRSDRSV